MMVALKKRFPSLNSIGVSFRDDYKGLFLGRSDREWEW